jgi:hypothetical protein
MRADSKRNESDLLGTDLLPIRTAVEAPVVCEAAPMAYATVIFAVPRPQASVAVTE